MLSFEQLHDPEYALKELEKLNEERKEIFEKQTRLFQELKLLVGPEKFELEKEQKLIHEEQKKRAQQDRAVERPDSAAKHFGFATLWLPECPHLAAAEVSRSRADPVGDCRWRARDRRDHHEDGCRP